MEAHDLRRPEEKERDYKLRAFLDQEFPGLVKFHRRDYTSIFKVEGVGCIEFTDVKHYYEDRGHTHPCSCVVHDQPFNSHLEKDIIARFVAEATYHRVKMEF